MPDEARIVLAQLLETHGPELADDPRRLRAMLADTLPGTADAKRIVAAAEEGIPAQLRAAGADDTGAIRLQLIHRLEEERDMTSQAAAWTVDSWAAALNIPLRVSTSAGSDDATRTIPAEHDEPPPTGRNPVLIAGAVIAALLLGGVLFVVLGLGPDDNETGETTPPTATLSPTATVAVSEEESPSLTAEPTPEITPDPTPTPSTFTAAEQDLLRWIPTDTADSCVSADYSNVGRPLAQLYCDLRGTDGVNYVSYRTPQEMRQEYEDFSRGPRDSGSCAQGDLPSEHDWNFEGGDPVGRYSCFRSEGTAFVVWTANYANILAWSYRNDGRMDRLYDAWLTPEAGPRSTQR